MPVKRTEIGSLSGFPGDADGPVFNEPWEAQSFALAVRLSEQGHFNWSDWATTLSEEIQNAQERGDPDLGGTYYVHWVSALERICIEMGLLEAQDLKVRLDEWRKAYLNTPHGMPIELSAATNDSG